MSLFQWFILAVLIVMTAINMASVLWECKEKNAKQKLKSSLKEKSEQLQNAIVPKFKPDQVVYYISEDDEILSERIICIHCFAGYKCDYELLVECAWFEEKDLFATREEAEKALAERGAQ